ncbi:hypothetical protein DBR00_11535 [Pseudomonas sp. HMWF032]|uniref:hypothetical protein n=1 Tax=Pseudomonas sp. HMWF032 TaxID=2056866 RepID=UPI000D3B9688|nr:hypothetical protein [Pseudomonas sp. HMWF032]PTS84005.1 hypothetical protein DBR00_11535 [Pseudomonas sp. HMWF032]PTT85360.1 hypothetical protein DBR41_04120 [Pseudomonas sp. HMWF010]
MPAPEDLAVQTPGENLTPAVTETPTKPANEQLEEPAKPADAAFNLGGPAFTAKHNGAGRWKIWFAPTEGKADWFSDFVGDKPTALVEAERLNAGGEPYVAATAPTKPAEEAKPTAKASGAVDPTTLKQPVMTAEGWLCPEPVVKE